LIGLCLIFITLNLWVLRWTEGLQSSATILISPNMPPTHSAMSRRA
jgi:hypothetical protein